MLSNLKQRYHIPFLIRACWSLISTVWAKYIVAAIMVMGLSACSNPIGSSPDTITVKAQHVYFVRHAEKQIARDPDLTEMGQLRAEKLMEILADKSIIHIHSSDTQRTRQTAQPLAKLNQLEIIIYDPRDLPTLARTIKASPGNHLVVGHSNTTAQAVLAIGGQDTEAPISDDEYDRLYHITITDDAITTDLIRFQPGPHG